MYNDNMIIKQSEIAHMFHGHDTLQDRITSVFLSPMFGSTIELTIRLLSIVIVAVVFAWKSSLVVSLLYEIDTSSTVNEDDHYLTLSKTNAYKNAEKVFGELMSYGLKPYIIYAHIMTAYILYLSGVRFVFTVLSFVFKDLDLNSMNIFISNTAYYYQNSFILEAHDKINKIKSFRDLLYAIIYSLLTTCICIYQINQFCKIDIIDLLEMLTPFVLIAIYIYSQAKSVDLNAPSKPFSIEELNRQIIAKPYISKVYQNECNDLKSIYINFGMLKPMFVIMVIYTIFGILKELFYNVKQKINDLRKKKIEFSLILTNYFLGFVYMIMIILSMNNIEIYFQSAIYLFKNYDIIAGTITSPSDMKKLHNFSQVDCIKVAIPKLIYLNTPGSLINESIETKVFYRELQELLYSGKNIEAIKYVEKSPTKLLKDTICEAIEKPSSTVLQDIYINMEKGIMSFVVIDKEKNSIKEFTIESDNGIIFQIKADSGQGKSTIINSIMGITKSLGSTINGKPSRFVGATMPHTTPSKPPSGMQLIPIYTDFLNEFVLSFSLLENFKIADPSITEEELIEYLKAFNMPQYETSINDMYSSLSFSKGQLVRMRIIRAISALNRIIKQNELKSFIFLADEPFDALDDTNKEIVMKTIKEYTSKYNLTFLGTDHSSTLSDNADIIGKIEDKTIKFFIKNDTNQEILAKDIQFDGDNQIIINGHRITCKDITKEELIEKYVYDELKEEVNTII
jgi:ABC-type lipoprotein export system ATPase subunit